MINPNEAKRMIEEAWEERAKDPGKWAKAMGSLMVDGFEMIWKLMRAIKVTQDRLRAIEAAISAAAPATPAPTESVGGQPAPARPPLVIDAPPRRAPPHLAPVPVGVAPVTGTRTSVTGVPLSPQEEAMENQMDAAIDAAEAEKQG